MRESRPKAAPQHNAQHIEQIYTRFSHLLIHKIEFRNGYTTL